MADLISALQLAWQSGQKLTELSKRVADADFKIMLAELVDNLADAKIASAQLKGQISSLMEENQSLRKKLQQREGEIPRFDGGLYYFGDDEHPFCTACFDGQEKQIRLTRAPVDLEWAGKWTCPTCRAHYP